MPLPSGLVSRLLQIHQVRYLIVAGCVALGYLSLLAGGLAVGWHYMVAITVAQGITIVCAFPAYRTFVFESQQAVALDFVRFLSVWSTGAIAGFIATPLLVEVVDLHPLTAQIIAIVVVAIGSYLGHRFFSFRPGPGITP